LDDNLQKQRQDLLKEMILRLHAGETVDDVKGDFSRLLRTVGASELADIEQALISEGLPALEVKRLCDVHVAVFREGLDTQAPPEGVPGHPIHTFRAENAAADKVLTALQLALEAVKATPGPAQLEQARQRLREMREYEKHYLRKENILFPYLERHGFSGPSSVMWAIHDDIRAGWKALDNLLATGPGRDAAGFNARLDATFNPLSTAIREMFYKEENILFPTSLQKLDNEEWVHIRAQESEIGYAYVQPSDQWPPKEADAPEVIRQAQETVPMPTVSEPDGVVRRGFPLDTGQLSLTQISLLLKHLPIDVTYVDENDTVRYYSEGKERIFPRTPAVIGRRVQQCHPPASLDRVQRILDAFRSGRRSEAEFWIDFQGRFTHIRYFAIRDAQGDYRGCLEVTQDVTHIRTLQGQRRLLDD